MTGMALIRTVVRRLAPSLSRGSNRGCRRRPGPAVRRARRRLVGAALAAGLLAGASGQAAEHPLDPLSFQEYWRVLEILRDAGRLDGATRFSRLTLRQPAKQDVLAWSAAGEGGDAPRAAYVLVRQGNDSFEAVIDLAAGEIASWTPVDGVQPNWHAEEFGAVVSKVLAHPEFVAGLKRRGIEDTTFLDCTTLPPGYYGREEERGRRLGHVSCADVRGVRNPWPRAVEGLTAVVDLESDAVVRVVDEGDAGVAPVNADYHRGPYDAPRDVPGPIHVSQPLGPGFDVDGYRVAWQNWRFHVRPDERAGVVLSLVRYVDGGRERSVLYEGHLSEIFVPYMDPSFGWYHRNFIDAGEFSGLGLTAPLMPGRDCPDHAVYFEATRAQANGRPHTIPRNVCLFEREIGDPSWRHGSDTPDSRAARDLVVRAAMVIGNYDYLLDWILRQDGSIVGAAGMTGIVEAKATRAAAAGEDPRADAYGRFVDRHVVAVNHDHYLSFRLDLDVDGTDNRFIADRLRTRILPDDHPRRSVWVRESRTVEREADAKLDVDLRRPTLWRVASVESRNHVGYPTSYRLAPGRNAHTLLAADDWPRRRVGFIDHHLWVTPHRDDERWAAGDHPTLSARGFGLPLWTAQDRSIADTDVVLWHTIGMHHLVRAEDWPVMPVTWRSFELRPFDFFDRNPALDLP